MSLKFEKSGQCPFHEAGIAKAGRLGEINPGYTEADARVIKRYRETTGCLRHEVAKDPQDICQVPGFHAMQRAYTIRDRIILPGLGSAHLYEETYKHLDRHAEATDRRLRGWRAIVPRGEDISPHATNVDFLFDYEPDRDNSGTNEPEAGSFNLAAIFDLKNPSTGILHPAKLVLVYNPHKNEYSGLTFTVFNQSQNGKLSHFYDKMDILRMDGGTTNRLAQAERKGDIRWRLLLGGADLGTDVDFEPNTSFRDFTLFYFRGNDLATRRQGSVDKERTLGERDYIMDEPIVEEIKEHGGRYITSYQPETIKSHGIPYWASKTGAFIDVNNNEFGFRYENAEASGLNWSLPMNILDIIELPRQDFRYSGSGEQTRILFPQLAQTFSDLVYGRLRITDSSISVT